MSTIKPKHNLMLIMLSNLSGQETNEEIYDRTRFAWKTNIDRARKVDFVISHNSKEEIVGIFKPSSWLTGDDKEFKSLDRGSYPDRIGFVGEIASDDILELYSDSTTPARKKGAANPIRYLDAVDSNEDKNDEDDLDLDALLEDLELEDDEEIDDDTEVQSIKNHTYLAGIEVEDEELDDLVSSVFKFIDAAYYKLSKNPEVYLIGSNNKDGKFLDSCKDLECIKIFKGSFLADDNEPNEDDVRGVLIENEALNFLDEGYYKVWLAFQYPEENSDDFEDPGEHWTNDFQQLAQNLDNLAMVGYHSEFEAVIWQQWADGDYDEGAISNQDALDHYSGQNIESVHSVDLGCLKILD
ncbi:MAG: hypothetical protein O3C54_07255 [Proteobacteria bacterium]|nr:hypothetical protein [Pseudomonadota bacterium]